MPKLLAVDAGIAHLGFAVMEYAPMPEIASLPLVTKTRCAWFIAELGYVETVKSSKKLGLRQADDNARRIAEATRALMEAIQRHEIKMMVAEIPDSGARSAKALKWMSYAAAMLVALAECCGLAVEWYTPSETRLAGGAGNVSSEGRVKQAIMTEMGRRWPTLELTYPTLGKREHVADALATFEAARNGVMVRQIEGGF